MNESTVMLYIVVITGFIMVVGPVVIHSILLYVIAKMDYDEWLRNRDSSDEHISLY